MNTFALSLRIVAAAAIAIPAALIAQQPLLAPVAIVSAPATALPALAAGAALVKPAVAATTPKALTARWLDLTTFSHSERYRNQYGDTGYHYFEDGQQRSMLAGKIRLDAQGRYDIGFRASSGRTFNWAYADYAGQGFAARLNSQAYDKNIQASADAEAINDAEAQDPAGSAFVNNLSSAGWEFYLRELYLSATPVKAVTLEVGSFGFERGFSSEITTFDDDGYLAGERLRLHDKAHLFFDEIGFTTAYFGYFDTPNLFARGGSFGKANYRQVYAKKQLNPRFGVSGEYNWLSGTQTLRQAVVADARETRLFDKVRLEVYERVSRTSFQGDNENPRQGFAVVGEKKVGKSLSGDFGFASIDRDYGLYSGSSFAQETGFSLNGDNYNTGIRVFSHMTYKINPVVSAFGFYTHITGSNIVNFATQGLNAGLTFDLKALVNTERRVF